MESNRANNDWVELTLSKPSGKVSSVVWNGSDITKSIRFKDHALLAHHISGGWLTPAGQSMQILIDRSDNVRSERDRYDLLLDGERFASLPRPRDVEKLYHDVKETRTPPSDGRRSLNQQHGSCRTPTDQPNERTDLERYRLSLAGLDDQGPSFDQGIEEQQQQQLHRDELHSERFSPVVESLREVITRAIPKTEHAVSRAIMAGFCSDASSRNSSDSVSIDGFAPPLEVEANLLRDTFYWIRGNRDECEEERLRYFEEKLEEVMQYVRAETFDAEDASRVTLNMAAILGLRMACGIPNTTVLIDGMPIGMNEQDLHAVFGEYGIVCAAAASSTLTFGFCRFASEGAAVSVVAESASPAGRFSLEGNRPTLLLLKNGFSSEKDVIIAESPVQRRACLSLDNDEPPLLPGRRVNAPNDTSPSCVSRYIFD